MQMVYYIFRDQTKDLNDLSNLGEVSEVIEPPSAMPNGRILRSFAKSVFGIVPAIGGAISEAADLLMPNPEAQDRVRWELEVTGLLNQIYASLGYSRLPRTDLAWKIGQRFWREDIEGKGRVGLDEAIVFDEFDGYSDANLNEAIAEMVHADWLVGWDDPNHKSGYGGFYLKPFFFACLDPIERGSSPLDDLGRVAEIMLACDEDAISSEQIDRLLAWENRRLFPALWLLQETVLASDCDNHWIDNYPFAWCYLSGETRRVLRSVIA